MNKTAEQLENENKELQACIDRLVAKSVEISNRMEEICTTSDNIKQKYDDLLQKYIQLQVEHGGALLALLKIKDKLQDIADQRMIKALLKNAIPQ